MLILALLICDLFGLHMQRIPDVNGDHVSDLLVANPMGDEKHPGDGHIMLVDPVQWTILKLYSASSDEFRLGSSVSVSFGKPGYVAVGSKTRDGLSARIRVLELNTLAEVLKEDVIVPDHLKTWTPAVMCANDAGKPIVLYYEPATEKGSEKQYMTMWMRTTTGRRGVSDIQQSISVDAGLVITAQLGKTGELKGVCTAAIPEYIPPFASEGGFPSSSSAIFWTDQGNRTTQKIVMGLPRESVDGITAIASPPAGNAEVGTVLLARRFLSGGGSVVSIGGATRSPEVLFTTTEHIDGFGSSLCQLADIDGDGVNDLAIGCPSSFGGSVLMIGSKTHGVLAAVTTNDIASGPPLERKKELFGFGASVAAIDDQDGDGNQELIVCSLSMGGSLQYSGLISVVSSRSRKITCVMSEQDLHGPR